MEWSKAYKAFNENLQCKGFQYEIGKEYRHEGNVKVCGGGFHACPNPLDVLRYYPPSGSRYCIVEQGGAMDDDVDDGRIIKRASKVIRIVREITVQELINEHCKQAKLKHYVEKKAKIAGDGEVATTGDNGLATAGRRGVATAGYDGMATADFKGTAIAEECGLAIVSDDSTAIARDNGLAIAGSYSVATAGYHGAATADFEGTATAGDGGVAIVGYKGTATAGARGLATAGGYGIATAKEHGTAIAGFGGVATSKGMADVGHEGIACTRGINVKVRGGLGALLVIAEEGDAPYGIRHWKAVIVDGETIKPDTWYKLNDHGEIEEA